MNIIEPMLDRPYLWGLALVTGLLIVLALVIGFLQGRRIKLWLFEVGERPAPPAPSLTASAKKQAAALCYRLAPQDLEVLLVRSSGRRWTLPKGRVHEGHSAWDVAQRSALEEAGVVGELSRTPLCDYLHLKKELKHSSDDEYTVQVYALRVTRQGPALEEHRDPTWFTWQDAIVALSEGRGPQYSSELEKVIARARQHLEPSRLGSAP